MQLVEGGQIGAADHDDHDEAIAKIDEPREEFTTNRVRMKPGIMPKVEIIVATSWNYEKKRLKCRCLKEKSSTKKQ